MIRSWWKAVCFVVAIGTALWFISIPLFAIYGAICPWPEARKELIEHGISGVPIMIGAGGDFHHSSDGTWSKEIQGSFVVIPDSFHKQELFTYFEKSGSDVFGTKRILLRSRFLIPLILLWISAGLFTFWGIYKVKMRRIHQGDAVTS